jgi:hypothetical protein
LPEPPDLFDAGNQLPGSRLAALSIRFRQKSEITQEGRGLRGKPQRSDRTTLPSSPRSERAEGRGQCTNSEVASKSCITFAMWRLLTRLRQNFHEIPRCQRSRSPRRAVRESTPAELRPESGRGDFGSRIVCNSRDLPRARSLLRLMLLTTIMLRHLVFFANPIKSDTS